jgi:hypothetical protein
MTETEERQPPDTRPAERAGRLFVPMLGAGCGVRLALFRDRHGACCAVGFSSAELLERVLGPGYEAWPLTRRVIGELAAERGVLEILVDPVLAAPAAGGPESVRRMAPQTSGAYQLSMSSTYNLVGRPPLVSVRDGAAHLIQRRETLADLTRRDGAAR